MVLYIESRQVDFITNAKLLLFVLYWQVSDGGTFVLQVHFIFSQQLLKSPCLVGCVFNHWIVADSQSNFWKRWSMVWVAGREEWCSGNWSSVILVRPPNILDQRINASRGRYYQVYASLNLQQSGVVGTYLKYRFTYACSISVNVGMCMFYIWKYENIIELFV